MNVLIKKEEWYPMYVIHDADKNFKCSNLPNELYMRYQANLKEFMMIQYELTTIYKKDGIFDLKR